MQRAIPSELEGQFLVRCLEEALDTLDFGTVTTSSQAGSLPGFLLGTCAVAPAPPWHCAPLAGLNVLPWQGSMPRAVPGKTRGSGNQGNLGFSPAPPCGAAPPVPQMSHTGQGSGQLWLGLVTGADLFFSWSQRSHRFHNFFWKAPSPLPGAGSCSQCLPVLGETFSKAMLLLPFPLLKLFSVECLKLTARASTKPAWAFLSQGEVTPRPSGSLNSRAGAAVRPSKTTQSTLAPGTIPQPCQKGQRGQDS